jgi:hypothetical protein
MALDYQTALSEYGAVATFAQSNPEVNTILQQAIAGEWDAARFERALWGTNWYKSLSDNQRQLQVQQVTDPGTYNQQVQAKIGQIDLLSSQLGKSLSKQDMSNLAGLALWNGWNDATLQAYVAQGYGNTEINGAMTGQAGDTENHIRSTYAAYGLPVTNDFVNQQVGLVLAGRQTTGGIDNQAIAAASKLYPQYAQDFTEGRTLSDIAQPFMQQMGTTLEIDPSSITLNDSTIQKALQGDGTTPMTLYQFNQSLKADPRWAKTDNAKNAGYDLLAQVGKDWGFTG